MLVLTVVAPACGGSSGDASGDRAASKASTTTATTKPGEPGRKHRDGGDDPVNLYAHAGRDQVAPATRGALPRVYVPNGKSGTVSVIDQGTKQVVATFDAGSLPQHIVPSYDLKTLWVLDNAANALIPIDPKTSTPGPLVPVDDPYNLYFTPDGHDAIVVAEERQRLDFRDPHTMALRHSLSLPCKGLNHIDFAADGRTLLATCEFAGRVVVVDPAHRRLRKVIVLGDGKGMPQDIRISPDGSTYFVADMMAGGVWTIDARTTEVSGFVATGVGAHGLYPSRDGTKLYVSNRGSDSLAVNPRHGPGSVSVIDFATGKVEVNWPVPGGGSPDMGNVSADGTELWLSGRYDREVYVFDTATGALKTRIPVGRGPHGLTVWPQPGRYSLGHTGNMR